MPHGLAFNMNRRASHPLNHGLHGLPPFWAELRQSAFESEQLSFRRQAA